MISDDLVNSYHLLLCALDLVYGNALQCSNRKELVNPNFKGKIVHQGLLDSPHFSIMCTWGSFVHSAGSSQESPRRSASSATLLSRGLVTRAKSRQQQLWEKQLQLSQSSSLR